jgi:periplasmic protein TonB
MGGAKMAHSEKPREQDDESAPAAAKSLDRAGYAQCVQAQIHSCRRKPLNGAHGSGIAVVSFTISGVGELLGASVSKSSGSAELDLLALDSVRNAGIFPPTPTGAEMRFSAPFQFK